MTRPAGILRHAGLEDVEPKNVQAVIAVMIVAREAIELPPAGGIALTLA
jgi:hypothetical protein